jgi:hypothetical protein
MHIMNKTKSIGAVLLGFITVFVLSILTDLVLHKAGLMPYGTGLGTGWLLIALAYRTAFTILGGYITAKLAPQNPMKHAIILGCIGMVAGTIGAIMMSDLGPAWYAWGLVVLAVPSTWLGGKWAAHRQVADGI